MLSREVARNKIIECISTTMSDFHRKIEDETDLYEDMGADSVDMATLLMLLEDEFDYEIADDDAEKLTTLGAILAYVMSIHKELESKK